MKKYWTKARPKPRRANFKSFNSVSYVKDLIWNFPVSFASIFLVGWLRPLCTDHPSRSPTTLAPLIPWNPQCSSGFSQLHAMASSGLPSQGLHVETAQPHIAWPHWLSLTVEKNYISPFSSILYNSKAETTWITLPSSPAWLGRFWSPRVTLQQFLLIP